MKKTIIFTIVSVVMMFSAAQASTITVAGTQITIPSNYNISVVEKRANACVATIITKVKTEKAAEMLPLVCTQTVLEYGAGWRKHI
jgi:hypothetical protein